MKIWKHIKFCFNYFRIPKGDYCYKVIKVEDNPNGSCSILTRHCPYWDKIEGLSNQKSGYCHWLEKGDIDINNDDSKEFKNVKTGEISTAPEMPFGVGILWDSVKECSLRPYSDKEFRKIYGDEK